MSDSPYEPTEEEISTIARHLWQEEGQPDGKADEHWARAQEQLRNARADAGQDGSGQQHQ